MKRLAMVLIAILTISPIAAWAGQIPVTDGICDLDTLLDDLRTQRLKRKEKNDLLFMREEEKMARDVYLSLYEQWGLRVFRQIANAERSHMDSALVLIDKYELEDPVGDNALGVFSNAEIQTLYEELSSAGQTSLAAALTVGATIEDVDIYDLEQAYERANNEDLRVLYQNLMKGSRNHLRSFVGLLEANGASYEPAFLTADEYEAILDTSREQGVLGVDGELLCDGR